MTAYAADEDGAAPTVPRFDPLAPCCAVIHGPYMVGGARGCYVAHDSHADAVATDRLGPAYRVIARGLTWAEAHRRRDEECAG